MSISVPAKGTVASKFCNVLILMPFLSSKAFLVRFITNRYIVDYDKGSDTRYKHEMMVDTDTVLFEILDSSSPITLNIKRFNFASHFTDLFLVVYSITDRNSFTYVRNLLKHLVLLKGQSGEMVCPYELVIVNLLLASRKRHADTASRRRGQQE